LTGDGQEVAHGVVPVHDGVAGRVHHADEPPQRVVDVGDVGPRRGDGEEANQEDEPADGCADA
jgi:hypothetical protein